MFWTANATDARGNVIDETLGNGVQTIRGYDQVTGTIDFIQSDAGATSIQNLSYSWDRVGNLTQRRDVRQNLTENFYYDNLHRLTSTTGPDPITIGYDPRGNITWRTGGFSESEAHTISWYSYNLPSSIEAGTSSSEFSYAPDRSRWKQVASYAGTSEQTIYIGGLMEKVTRGTEVSWKHYIAGGSGIVALYTRKSTGTNELAYVTKDHLGSIDSITTSGGTEIARLSFGAWGERRNESTWNGAPSSSDWTEIESTTRRGFTSHEMLDNLGLTHMNGRVYDQMIGQFVSADPFIDGPMQTSGWNRYSYVHNNPLSFSDPGGFEIERPSVRPNDPNNRSYSLADFLDMARGGFNGIVGGIVPPGFERPDLWSLRRNAVPPGSTPWPDWNTPPDGSGSTPSRSHPFPVQAGNADSWSTGGLNATDRPGTNYIDFAVGRRATSELNRLLKDVAARSYKTTDDAVIAWATAARQVSDRFDVEVGVRLFLAEDRYWLSTSISDGVICSRSAQCSVNVLPLSAPVQRAVSVGYAHTHPDNGLFSGGDLGTAYFLSQTEARTHTAYVVLANSQIWSWSTDIIRKHPQPGATTWAPYVEYSRRVR